MPTPAERQALLFVAAVAALGVGVRGYRAVSAAPPAASDRVALAAQMAAVDSAITSGGARRTAGARRAPESPAGAPRSEVRRVRPPRESDSAEPTGEAQGRLVDLDVAGVNELDRLPGIGPALAARIVADRDANGPFGSLPRLERVRGIGPSLAKKLEPHVTFSLSPRHSDTEVPLRERVVRP